MSRNNPQAQLVPIYLENLNRVLPKGSRLVVPIICSATFGPPIEPTHENEDKTEFPIKSQKCVRGVTSWIVSTMKFSGSLSGYSPF
ncbi:acyltransferase [Proteus mirabilis]|uniref:Acyltransferase n=1 Tax=Proteus mirabilis TaxID=584 RepID=A0A2X2C7I8_PROMI|nr:acyltransferase [Proteus mirabilis]